MIEVSDGVAVEDMPQPTQPRALHGPHIFPGHSEDPPCFLQAIAVAVQAITQLDYLPVEVTKETHPLKEEIAQKGPITPLSWSLVSVVHDPFKEPGRP
jgi:hypothetical protein